MIANCSRLLASIRSCSRHHQTPFYIYFWPFYIHEALQMGKAKGFEKNFCWISVEKRFIAVPLSDFLLGQQFLLLWICHRPISRLLRMYINSNAKIRSSLKKINKIWNWILQELSGNLITHCVWIILSNQRIKIFV